MGFPPIIQPSVPVSDIDLTPYLQGANKQPENAFIPEPINSGVDLSGKGYAPAPRTFARENLESVGGYNAFKEEPRYNPDFSPLGNIRSYAAGQGTGEWWANNFAKLGHTAANSFVNFFKQDLRNVQALTTQNPYKLYDQEDTSKQEQQLDYKYPTFGTGELDNSAWRFFPTNWGKSDFGGSMIPQLGFTIGTMGGALLENLAITAVTGGFGEAAELGKNLSTAGKVFEGFKNLFETSSGVKNFRRGLQILETVKKESGLANTAVKGLKSLANMYSLYNSAAGEGAMEASQNYAETKNTLIADFVKNNGYQPFGDDMVQIEDMAKASGLRTFGWNIPVLMASNFIQFGNFLKPFKSVEAEALTHGAVSLTGKGLAKTAVLDVANETMPWKFAKGAWNILKEGASEGFEEVSQSLIQNTSTGLYQDMYNNLKFGSKQNNEMNSVFEYFGSTAFMNDFAGGFLGGVIFKGIGAVADKTGLSKNTEQQIKRDRKVAQEKGIAELNNEIFTPENQGKIISYLFDPANQNFITQISAQEKMQAAKNLMEHNDAQSESIRQMIYTGLRTGKLELALSSLDVFNELDNETIANYTQEKDLNKIEEQKAKAEELVSLIKERAGDMQSDFNTLNEKYQNPYQAGSDLHTAYEMAKRDRLFARDIIADDRRTSKYHKNDMSKKTAGLINKNMLDLVLDAPLRKTSIKQAEEIVNSGMPGVPDMDKRRADLKLLQQIDSELESANPDFDKIGDNILKLSLNNPTVAPDLLDNIIVANDKELKSTAAYVAKLDYRHKKNVEDYFFLNNVPIGRHAEMHRKAQVQLIADLKKAAENYAKSQAQPVTPVTPTATPTQPQTPAPPATPIITVIDPLEVNPDSVEKLDEQEQEVNNDYNYERLKSLQRIAVSTTRPAYHKRNVDKHPEYIHREEDFLNNLLTGKFDSKGLVVIPITALNHKNVAAKMGLPDTAFTHIINQAEGKFDLQGQADGEALSAHNEQANVTFVYAKVDANKYTLLDVNGAPITAEFENKVVQGRMVTGNQADLEKKINPRQGGDSISPEQKQYVGNYNRKFRKYLTENQGFMTFNYDVSFGVDAKNEDSSRPYIRRSVVEAGMITPDEINGGSIFIADAKKGQDSTVEKGQLILSGRPYLKVPFKNANGKLMFKYQYLDNQNLTPKQIDGIIKAIQAIQEEIKNGLANTDLPNNKAYLYLRALLQVTTGQPVTDRQIKFAISAKKNFTATFKDNKGVTNSVDLAGDLTSLRSFLEKRFHNVDRGMSRSAKEFYDYASDKTFKNYNIYLLTSEGTPLTVRTPEGATQPYIQRYSIVDVSKIKTIGPIEVFQKPKPKVPEGLQSITVVDEDGFEDVINTPMNSLDEEGVKALEAALGVKPKTPTATPTPVVNDAKDFFSMLHGIMKEAESSMPTVQEQNTEALGTIEETYQEEDNYVPSQEEEAAAFAKSQYESKIAELDNPALTKGMSKSQKEHSAELAKQEYERELEKNKQTTVAIVNPEPKEVSEEAKEGDDVIDTMDLSEDDDAPFAQTTRDRIYPTLSDEDVAEFNAWLQQNLPKFGFTYNPKTAVYFQDQEVIGRFLGDHLYAYAGADKSTPYHEAFEGVWNAILTKKYQDVLLKDFRSRKGSFVAYTGETVVYSNATDMEAKEQMADEFLDWKLSKPVKSDINKNFFQKIWDYLKKLVDYISRRLGIYPTSITTLYENMDSGYYRDAKLRTAEGQYFSFGNGNLNARQRQEFLSSMAAELFSNITKESAGLLNDLDEELISEDEVNAQLKKLAINYFKNSTNNTDAEAKRRLRMSMMHRKRFLVQNGMADVDADAKTKAEFKEAKHNFVEYIEKDWDNFWTAIKNYTSGYGIKYNTLTTYEDEEANKVQEKEGTKGASEYVRDPLTNSVKKSISKSVKLILGTLVEQVYYKALDMNIDIISDTSAMPSVIKDYNKLFNRMLNYLTNINDRATLEQRLKELATVSEAEKVLPWNSPILLNKAQFQTVYDTFFKKTLDEYTEADLKLAMKFQNSWSKQTPQFLRTKILENGRIMFENEWYEKLNTQFLNNMMKELRASEYAYRRNNTGFWLQKEKRKFVVKPQYLPAPVVYGSPEYTKRLAEGLAKLGASKITPEFIEALSDDEQRNLIDEFNGAVNNIPSVKEMHKITPANLGISSRLRAIAGTYSIKVFDESEPMHINAEGEQQQNAIDNNFISLLLSDINNMEAADFYKKHPYMNDHFQQYSLLLQKLFAKPIGTRSKGLTIISGLEGGRFARAKAMSATSQPEREMILFNASLSTFKPNSQSVMREAIYPILHNADGSIDWCLQVGDYLTDAEINSNKLVDVFYNYLVAEVNFAMDYIRGESPERQLNEQLAKTVTLQSGRKQKIGETLQFFSNIAPNLSEIIHDDMQFFRNSTTPTAELIEKRILPDAAAYKAKLAVELNDFIQKKVEADKKYFTDNEWLLETAEGNYIFYGLDESIDANLSEYGLQKLLKNRQVNYVINNIESFKVFFGAPGYYKDGHKRFKSTFSPALTQNEDGEINRVMTKLLNKVPQSDKTYHTYSNEFKHVSVPDIETYNDSLSNPAFHTNNATDAQMYMRLAYIKELLYKSGGKWTNQMQKQLDVEDAYMRMKLSDKKDKEGNSYYTYSSTALQKADLDLLKPFKINGEYNLILPDSFIAIVKPIQRGPKNLGIFEPSLLKTSIAPLTYSMVEGTKMEQIFLEMFQKDIASFGYSSAHKVGQPKTTGKLIGPDGQLRSITDVAPVENLVMSTVGLQVETQSQKDYGTAGTQAFKHITSDVYNSGVPRDYKGKSEGFELNKEWENLTEEEKRKASELYTLDQEHKDILSAMFKSKLDSLIQSLGNGTDNTQLFARLKDAITSFGVPQHVLDQFQERDGKLVVPMEMMADYDLLRFIIFSMMDREFLSPKLYGGMKIQMSSILLSEAAEHGYSIMYKDGDTWKKAATAEEVGDKKYVVTDTGLKFYQPDGKKTKRAQVKISSRILRDTNAKRAELKLPALSETEFLKYLNENQSKLLEVIGFRIPTQEMNSIDAFEIVGFLPHFLGDAIAVPPELTTKAGSDFDVDKLTMYINNFRWNKEGLPEMVEYSTGTDTESENKRFIQYVRRNTKKYSAVRDDLKASKEYLEGEEKIESYYDKYGQQKKITASLKDDISNLRVEGEHVFGKLPTSLKQYYWEVETQIKSLPFEEKTRIYKDITEKFMSDMQTTESFILPLKMEMGDTTQTITTAQVMPIMQEMIDNYNQVMQTLGMKQASYEHAGKILDTVRGKKRSILRDLDLEIANVIAEFTGLKTIDEFTTLPIAEQNSEEAIENKYFESMANLLLHPANFDQLISPNSTWDFGVDNDNPQSYTKQIMALKGDKVAEKFFNPGEFLDFQNMVQKRSSFLEASQKRGIAVVGGTTHTIFQRVLAILNPRLKEQNFFKDDPWSDTIKFGHNQVERGDGKYATVSGIMSADGSYNIAKYISQFINGTVDVTKDNWLEAFGAYGDAFAPSITALRLGINPLHIGLMINNPLVKEYMRIQSLRKSPVYKMNPTLKQKYGELYSDSAFYTFFQDELRLSKMENNKEQYDSSDIQGLKDHLAFDYQGFVAKARTSQFDKELALSVFRQFLQIKAYSQDLRLVNDSTNHETMPYNNQFLVPFKDHKYSISNKRGVVLAYHKNEETGEGEWIPAARALRKSTFVGDLVDQLKRGEAFLYDNLFLSNTKVLVDKIVEYLSKNDTSELFFNNLIDQSKKLEVLARNAMLHTSQVPEGMKGFSGFLKDHMEDLFSLEGKTYKTLTDLKRASENIPDSEKMKNGLLVFNYLNFDKVGEKSDYYYIRVQNKPSSRDIVNTNMLYEAFNNLHTFYPEVYDALMLAGIAANGISYTRDNISNMMNREYFWAFSKSIEQSKVNDELFEKLTDIYVQNYYRDPSNEIVTHIDDYGTIPTWMEITPDVQGAVGVIDNVGTADAILGKQFASLMDQMEEEMEMQFESAQGQSQRKKITFKRNENFIVFPAESYKKVMHNGTFTGQSARKSNYGIGKQYIMIKPGGVDYVLKHTGISFTHPDLKGNPTVHHVYSHIPYRGVRSDGGALRILEAHVPLLADERNSTIKANTKIRQFTKDEVLKIMQTAFPAAEFPQGTITPKVTIELPENTPQETVETQQSVLPLQESSKLSTEDEEVLKKFLDAYDYRYIAVPKGATKEEVSKIYEHAGDFGDNSNYSVKVTPENFQDALRVEEEHGDAVSRGNYIVDLQQDFEDFKKAANVTSPFYKAIEQQIGTLIQVGNANLRLMEVEESVFENEAGENEKILTFQSKSGQEVKAIITEDGVIHPSDSKYFKDNIKVLTEVGQREEIEELIKLGIIKKECD